MAQKLQTVSIEAAGFAGINTQDSPTAIDPSFAAKADNCIIDQFGRVGSRKGGFLITDTYGGGGGNYIASNPVESLFEFTSSEGVSTTFLAGGASLSNNNFIFKDPVNLEDISPSNYTITANNWKIVSLADKVYFFQKEHEPLIWDGNGNIEQLSTSQHSNGTPPQANEVLAAYGKLWAADIEGNKHTVYWSDTLLGGHWNGGASGSLDLRTVFPSGFDEVTALAAHNGFLLIFCRNCIIIYSGAESPASMVLHDIVEGIGCIERDSVQNTGTDIIFLSSDGLRSFGRTIQEKSSPVGNLSKNVRNDLTASAKRHTGPIKSIYSPEEGFYLLAMPDEDITYCFDMQGSLPDGSARVTTWSQIDPRSFLRSSNGDILFGKKGGVYKYTGYLDDIDASTKSQTYVMNYQSNPMDFNMPSNLKFLKKLEASVIGNVGELSKLKWYYDYNPNTKKEFTITPPTAEPNSAEFSAVSGQAGHTGAEFSAVAGQTGYTGAEFTSGLLVQTPHANGTGSGRVLTIGVDAIISGSAYSIQRIDTQVLLGRTL